MSCETRYLCLPPQVSVVPPDGGAGGCSVLTPAPFAPCLSEGFVGALGANPAGIPQGRLRHAAAHSYDVFGSDADLPMPHAGDVGPYAVMAMGSPVQMEPVDAMSSNGSSGCRGEWACTYVHERGSTPHSVQCRRGYRDAFNAPCGPGPLQFLITLTPRTKTQLLTLQWTAANRLGQPLPVTGGAQQPCWQSLIARCLHEAAASAPLDVSYYHGEWDNLRLGFSSDWGSSTSSDPRSLVADRPAAWRRVYDAALQAIRAEIDGLAHEGESARPSPALSDTWTWASGWGCEAGMPEVAAHATMRIRGRTTGVVVPEAKLVVQQAAATVSIAPLYMDLSFGGVSDERLYILAEVTISGVLGIRRTSHVVHQWTPRRYPDQPVALDFGSQLCNRFAQVLSPDGHAWQEELVAEVFDSTSGRWLPAPTHVSWRGFLGPADWAHPAMTNRMSAVPAGFASNAQGQCCDALYAVHGSVVGCELTDGGEPSNPDRQELRGSVVLVIPGMVGGRQPLQCGH